MIVIMTPQATKEQITQVINTIKGAGLEVHLSAGEERTII